MKKLSKVLVLVLSTIMVLAMSASVFAAVTQDSNKGGDATITITLPTDSSEKDQEITYTVYKVFNATTNGSAIAYQIDSVNGTLSEDMEAAGFSVDGRGNVSGPESLNASALAAIKAYAKDSVGTFKAKPSDGTLVITGLEYGYYYITTTTGAAVSVSSTNPNASVEDKNSIPAPPDKKVTGVSDGSLDEAGQQAVAAVGSKVSYSVDIIKVKGATNYVFHDKMSEGLSYNNDVSVTPAGAVYDATTAAGDTITIKFDNAWLAGLADNTKITITYSATVTSDALVTDPANNTASLDYGDGHSTDSDTVDVYNAQVTVKKTDGTNPLVGAGFTLYKKNGENWDVVKVINSTEDQPLSTFVFTGLGAGDYKLEETQVPDGYNKAEDQTFSITTANTTANLDREITVVNNAGSVLPGTGGIGTTIFYVLGSLLVVGCGIVLVSRRRMQNNK